MTMLDDERLASLLGRAGAAFDVPATGVDDIMARAAVASLVPEPRAARLIRTARAAGPRSTCRRPPSPMATAGCAAWWPSPAATACSPRPPASWSRS